MMRLSKYGYAVFAVAIATPAVCWADDVKEQAVIISVSGNRIDARTREGPLAVVLAPDTTIKETSGIATKKTRDAKSLIPGLIFTVSGDEQSGTVAAKDIRFKQSDWHSAVAAKAGTVAQFTALKQAIIDGQEYVIRGETTVYFPTASATVGPNYREELRDLAQKAPSYGNYRISVLGFADPRGNSATNERLSARRALAVSDFLRQTGLIEPGRVLAPSPMGEGTVAPGESAPRSDDQARRVVVRVVTPKLDLQR